MFIQRTHGVVLVQLVRRNADATPKHAHTITSAPNADNADGMTAWLRTMNASDGLVGLYHAVYVPPTANRSITRDAQDPLRDSLSGNVCVDMYVRSFTEYRYLISGRYLFPLGPDWTTTRRFN